MEQELSAIAGLRALEIARWRQERLRDGDQFLDNRAFAELVSRHLEAPGDEQARQQLLGWMGRVLVDQQYDQARLIDPLGEVRLSEPAARASGEWRPKSPRPPVPST